MIEGTVESTLPEAPANSEAFVELVRRHQSMVFGMAYSFLRDRSAAEEVAQDVFLELHRNLASLSIASPRLELAEAGAGAQGDRPTTEVPIPHTVDRDCARTDGAGYAPRSDARPLTLSVTVTPDLSPIVFAAGSETPGALSPGEVITIFGGGLG